MVSMRNQFWLAMLLALCFLPLASQAASTPHWVHYTLLEKNPKLPKKLLILPVNVEVLEVTAGDVEEEVPAWSDEASAAIMQALVKQLSKDPNRKLVALPKLSDKSIDVVDEHMALYKLVVNTASGIGWKHKIQRFDYGIGPGLKALRKKTGADAVVMVYGQDKVSTAGRKTKAVLGRIPIVNWFSGPPPKLGHSFVHIGIIDLNSGDLLWMNSEYREGTSNLRNPEHADSIVEEIFGWYPGIERYRKVYLR